MALQARRALSHDVELAQHPAGRAAVAAREAALRGSPHINRDEVQHALSWARRRVPTPEGQPRDGAVAFQVVYLLGQVHVLGHGATPLGQRWDFIDS